MRLDKFFVMAQKLFPYRKVLLILISLLTLNIIYSFIFLSPKQQDAFAVPCLLAMIWLLLCYLLLVFSQKKLAHFEQTLNKNPHLFTRIKMKLLSLFYLLLGLCFLILTLIILLLSFRLLNAWF